MSDKQYSDFTLNFNPAARGNDQAPTLKGKSKIIDGDNSVTEFEVAAWGPKKASTGGPDYYDVTFTPLDAALAARQMRSSETAPVRNAIQGFELTKVGYGKIFERTDDEVKTAAATGKNLPKFFGHVLVGLASGPVAIDLSAWNRGTFYSGNARLHDPAVAAAARAGKPAPQPQ